MYVRGLSKIGHNFKTQSCPRAKNTPQTMKAKTIKSINISLNECPKPDKHENNLIKMQNMILKCTIMAKNLVFN